MTESVLRVRGRGRPVVLFSLLMSLVVLFVAGTDRAMAAPSPVGLGTAGNFAILAGSTVTNTGATTVTGDLGLHPGTAVTGFPPGIVGGTIHATDAVALQAKTDLTTAYNDAAGRVSDATVSADLGGQTLVAGVYTSASSLGLTGTLTLDAQGDSSAVFIFQAGSTLTTASGSQVNLIGGAQACNVYWQIGSSATLGTNSVFRGNILALTSISVTTGVTVIGSTLARNGAVTLDTDTITRATCAAAAPTTTTTSTTSPTTTLPGTGTGTTPGAGPGQQVGRVPVGGVATGGGSTAGAQDLALLATGGLLLAAAGGAWVVRRRVTRTT